MEFFHIAYDRIRETNRYAVAAGVFLLWMLTLADVDLIRMVQTHQERLDIETKKAGHEARIAELDTELQRMSQDPGAKERHAREAYYMHKPEEDVFVFR